MYETFFKRILDVAVSSLAIAVLSPILLLTALAVRLGDAGPALFRQTRTGRSGRPFRVFKFRSMPVQSADLPSAGAAGLKVTAVGKVIRRTNIDELPQLFNIFCGEMSLVGPRPPLPAQADLIRMRRENKALECRPGLTGLAQVNSYDGMPEAEKARWDGQYASHITFIGDLRLIVRTLGYLVRRPPVY
jgi:O-antigen biosynthesis protein WbqP